MFLESCSGYFETVEMFSKGLLTSMGLEWDNRPLSLR